MSVVLKEAIRQAGCADIKLVAGKNGLTNAVEWVHMVDTTEIADFLSGGEIAFTTGIGVGEKMSLLALVDRVYKNHASAMVVNIGPYVAEIPQEVIDFGNAHDFPVFEVPWSVHMADMMRMICFTITQSQQRAMQFIPLCYIYAEAGRTIRIGTHAERLLRRVELRGCDDGHLRPA